jgi:hypothetical protein
LLIMITLDSLPGFCRHLPPCIVITGYWCLWQPYASLNSRFYVDGVASSHIAKLERVQQLLQMLCSVEASMIMCALPIHTQL